MKTIVLLRHGATVETGQRRYLGRRDVPLSEQGQDQMLQCAEQLRTFSVETIYSSPLTRCRRSAELIGEILGISVEVERDLIEINLGDWDGLPVETVLTKYPEAYAERGRNLSGYRPPDGECFNDVDKRVWPVLKKITRIPGESVAIIGHAGVNRVLLCHILGLPLNNLFRLGQDYGCINIIDSRGSRMVCRTVNCPPRVDFLTSR